MKGKEMSDFTISLYTPWISAKNPMTQSTMTAMH